MDDWLYPVDDDDWLDPVDEDDWLDPMNDWLDPKCDDWRDSPDDASTVGCVVLRDADWLDLTSDSSVDPVDDAPTVCFGESLALNLWIATEMALEAVVGILFWCSTEAGRLCCDFVS